MSSSAPTINVLLSAIPGAGKSAMLNILAGAIKFLSQDSAGSVTRVLQKESVEFKDDAGCVRAHLQLLDVNGLAEAKESEIAANKKVIEEGFATPGEQVVPFIFNLNMGGRILACDVENYNAVKTAFEVRSEAIVFVLNRRKVNRPVNYDGQVLLLLRQLIGWGDGPMNYLFIDEQPDGFQSDLGSPANRQLRASLVDAILRAVPRRHVKTSEISLDRDRIKAAEAQIKDFDNKIKVQDAKHAEAINKMQAEHNRTMEELRKKNKGGIFSISIGLPGGGGFSVGF